MVARRVAVVGPVLAGVVAVLVAGCSAATSGTAAGSAGPGTVPPSGSTGPGRPAGNASTSGTPAAGPGATITSVAEFGRRTAAALAGLHSLQIDLTTTAAGQQITGSGGETLDHGMLTAADIHEQLGSIGSLRVVYVDKAVYLGFPAQLRSEFGSSKPWLLVSGSSSNPVVRRLATTIEPALQSASVNQVTTYVKAARSVSPLGTTTVRGVPATRYRLTIVTSRLPSSLTFAQGGLLPPTFAYEVDLDAHDRPVRYVAHLTAQGVSTTSTVDVHDFDAPLTISAPPTSQVQR